MRCTGRYSDRFGPGDLHRSIFPQIFVPGVSRGPVSGRFRPCDLKRSIFRQIFLWQCRTGPVARAPRGAPSPTNPAKTSKTGPSARFVGSGPVARARRGAPSPTNLAKTPKPGPSARFVGPGPVARAPRGRPPLQRSEIMLRALSSVEMPATGRLCIIGGRFRARPCRRAWRLNRGWGLPDGLSAESHSDGFQCVQFHGRKTAPMYDSETKSYIRTLFRTGNCTH